MNDWNRCDVCGKFIPMKDFDSGRAKRAIITEETEYTAEGWQTLCRNHYCPVMGRFEPKETRL